MGEAARREEAKLTEGPNAGDLERKDGPPGGSWGGCPGSKQMGSGRSTGPMGSDSHIRVEIGSRAVHAEQSSREVGTDGIVPEVICPEVTTETREQTRTPRGRVPRHKGGMSGTHAQGAPQRGQTRCPEKGGVTGQVEPETATQA